MLQCLLRGHWQHKLRGCASQASAPQRREGDSSMRLAVPDLISNSYFPAIAAVELGFFQDEGLDVQLDLVFPVPQTMAALRDGELDFVAGAAHATLMAFPEWQARMALL